MQGQLQYRLAQEHITDLRRAAERDRFARSAKREGIVSRLTARAQVRRRPIDDRAPARVAEHGSTRAGRDAAAAEA